MNDTVYTHITFYIIIDGDTALHNTASAINPSIKEYKTTLNEAYDTIGSVIHPNIAYESIKTGRGTIGGIQANVAYESVRANAPYDVVQVNPTEPTERICDTINK